MYAGNQQVSVLLGWAICTCRRKIERKLDLSKVDREWPVKVSNNTAPLELSTRAKLNYGSVV